MLLWLIPGGVGLADSYTCNPGLLNDQMNAILLTLRVYKSY